MSEPNIPEVDPTQVPADAYLLDVREPEEWQAGHAPQATHVPLGQLAAHAGEIPTDRHVYVICRSGGRSAQATQALNEGGWQASNVRGGMQQWASAGLAMTSVDGEPRVA
ncbi:rhodanese-like domain-containing protein [Lipingzhangella sp. LS1_29]|uniref:Rhodanese-like domain-containing protein n=1 Tax=Lipingzhangella rawalii TaxID=2055835 RepID=A0ABU2H8N2_9ACTN|nr:rhodanese-like domain-containing protein [Lipingzhangella rawalii]MDS1271663.1 rhodanese-like domain-containing protein [Lipingzhangella rawalii]